MTEVKGQMTEALECGIENAECGKQGNALGVRLQMQY
jgi:hypothetical protein